MRNRYLLLPLIVGALIASIVACSGTESSEGPAGAKGDPGAAGYLGPAGPAGAAGEVGATGPAGSAGTKGAAGSAGAKGDTGSAGAAGAAGAVGAMGSAGPAGPAGPEGSIGAPGPLQPGVERELIVTLAVSKPGNGTHLVVGESSVITVTLADQFGQAFTREELSQARLAIAGPQETTKTVTAVKLLNASSDRSESPHHYIDLIKNPDVKVSGNVITYDLKPVSDEAPGTYVASFWAVLKADSFQQKMPVAEFQIGTATVEKKVVESTKCATCHLGAASGQFYFHHVDPGSVGESGYPSIDQGVISTCKTCHNNDGYAGYHGDIADPSASTDDRTADPIVRRVHGVHNGSGLQNAFNIDPETGDFSDYLEVVFPADVKNCETCHVDDSWKTKPSQLACGACHDGVWFGEETAMPANYVEAHAGGPQVDDQSCAVCHAADTGGMTPPGSISVVHKVELDFKNTVELALSAPANGEFYVAGEAPILTIVLKNAATGDVIDPATIVEPVDSSDVQANEWRRANLFVSGPRDHTVPVLTTAAAKRDPDVFYAENDLRVLNDAEHFDPKITRTGTNIIYQLDDVNGLEPGTYTAFVEVTPSSILGGWQLVNFQVGTETPEPKIATNCTQCHGDNRQHPEYFALSYDTDICKSCHDYERQGESVGWDFPGGWNGYGSQPIVRKVHGVHFGEYLASPEDIVFPALRPQFDFSGTIFPQDVRNCTKCHAESDSWTEKPTRLACLACHDSDAAITHAGLQTSDPTPLDAWNGDEAESCLVCHGARRDFAPDVVHAIADPYAPPYPRH